MDSNYWFPSHEAPWEWKPLQDVHCQLSLILSPLWHRRCRRKWSLVVQWHSLILRARSHPKKEQRANYYFAFSHIGSGQKREPKDRFTAQWPTLFFSPTLEPEGFLKVLSNQRNPLSCQSLQSTAKVASTSYLSNFIAKPCCFIKARAIREHEEGYRRGYCSIRPFSHTPAWAVYHLRARMRCMYLNNVRQPAANSG